MISSTVDFDDMVPITREELRKTYELFPVEPVSQDLLDSLKDLEDLVDDAVSEVEMILNERGDPDGSGSLALSSIRDCLALKPPNKIEENIFLSQSQLEEIWTVCEEDGTSSGIAELAHQSFEDWESYQRNSRVRIEQLIDTFLPSDWRRSMFDTVRSMSEQNAAAEMQAIKDKGCTVAEKYELLWRHELNRRQTLASIGNMNGVFKSIASTVGGVPRSLLDFISTINSDDGPTQEMRDTYGPTQYFLTHFVYVLRASVSTFHVMKQFTSLPLKDSTLLSTMEDVLSESMKKYCDAVHDYVALLKVVLVNSPFFVSRKDLEASNLRNGKPVDVVVTNEYVIEYPLHRGESVTWEFCTDKDIKFEVLFFPSCTSSCRDPKNVHPLSLVNSHLGSVKGLFTSNAGDGVLKLRFDNSYSWFTNKQLHIVSMVNPGCQKILPDMLCVDTNTTVLTPTIMKPCE